MKHHIASALALVALIAATAAGAQTAPTPAASPTPAPRSALVTCQIARLYLFSQGDNRPTALDLDRGARQGEQLTIVSGPRTTLDSNAYYETTIPIVEPGSGLLTHYFVNGVCISIQP